MATAGSSADAQQGGGGLMETTPVRLSHADTGGEVDDVVPTAERIARTLVINIQDVDRNGGTSGTYTSRSPVCMR